MKTRPFNLDEYIANPNLKVVTREGENVRILATDCIDKVYPIAAECENGEVRTFMKSGKHCVGTECSLDLVFVIEPKYRPYANADECFEDVKKHGGWVTFIRCNFQKALIIYVANEGVSMASSVQCHFSFEDLLTQYSWADDNTPCGKLEE